MTAPAFDERMRSLVALAERHMADDHVPGLQIGVACDDDEAVAVRGIADVTTGRSVGDMTMFRIASITKTFTATLLVQLAARGKIGLDDHLRDYVPEFSLRDRDAADRVTIRNCLLHTGGWIPHLARIADGPDALVEGARSQSVAQQIAPPGAYFSYNGVGYMVAGRVIEVVTGLPYEEAIRSMLLAPLAMTRTKFTTEADDDVAADHTVRSEAAAPLADAVETRWGHPSGGLRSTVSDLLRFAHCHFGETPVLDDSHARTMAQPQQTVPTPWESKALSWFVRDLGAERLLLHLGGAPGQMSLLALCPRRKFALAVLTNSAAGHVAGRTLLAHALELFLQVREAPEPALIALDRAHMAEYRGRYDHMDGDIIVAVDGDALVMRLENKGVYAQRPSPPPTRLRFWAEDRVVGVEGFAKGQYGDFLRGPRGDVAYFRWSTRARPRVGDA